MSIAEQIVQIEVNIMLSLVLGLGFILLGILPYGYLSFYLLKDVEH